MDNDADITGADLIQGFNDLRLAGDASGVDLIIAADGTVTGLTATLTACEDVADGCEEDGERLIYLDRMNNLTCPAEKVLVDFGVNNCGGGRYQAVFRCCAITVQ